MTAHPYREAPPPRPALRDEGPDWGLTAPLVALLVLCSARVALALARRESFGAEPSLALLVAALAARLAWRDVAEHTPKVRGEEARLRRRAGSG